MGDISENFSRSEAACPCGCGGDTVDAELLDLVQGLRDEFGDIITVHSGYRCKRYNAKLGGAKNSEHRWGRAWDIYPGPKRTRNVDLANENWRLVLQEMHQHLKNWMGQRGGLKIYMDRPKGKIEFIHVDTRSGKGWHPEMLN